MKKTGPLTDRGERAEAISDILSDCFQHESGDYEDDGEYANMCYSHAQQFLSAVDQNNLTDLENCFVDVDDEEFHSSIASELMLFAAQLGHVDSIRALLKFGGASCVNAVDEHKGGTPLMYACHNGHTAAVKTLVDPPCSALLDLKDHNGYTALMICTFCDRAAAAEILLKAGASVDKECQYGRTALSYAAHYGSLDCLQVLGNAGADPFHEDAEGSSILDLAEDSGRPGCAEAVRKMQLKARMHKKLKERKTGDSKSCHSNGLRSDAERRRAEAEAEARAAQLLAEIELEDKKSAKPPHESKQQPSKRDKSKTSEQQQQQQPNLPSTAPNPAASKHLKGGPAKSNGGSQEASTSSTQHQQQTPVHLHRGDKESTQPREAAQAGRNLPGTHQPRQPTLAPPHTNPQPHSVAQGGVQGSGSSSSGGHSIASNGKQTRAAAAAAAPPAPAGPSDVQLLQAALRGDAPPDDHDILRRQWEAVLQEAGRCREEQEQPILLATVQRLLPVCNEAGISVKYGRKVLQRLEVVAPARASLQSALIPPWSAANLEAALRSARPAASLLNPALLTSAEAALEHCKAEEERSKWDMLASQLRRNSNMPPSGTATVDQQQQYATTAPQTASSVSLPTMLLPPQAGLQGLGVVPAAQPSPTMAGFAPPVSYMAGGGSSVQAPIYMHGMQPHAGSASAYQEPVVASACEAPPEEEIECVVCLEAERAVICVPCMHICMCAECAADIQKRAQPECPVCRGSLEDVFEIAC